MWGWWKKGERRKGGKKESKSEERDVRKEEGKRREREGGEKRRRGGEREERKREREGKGWKGGRSWMHILLSCGGFQGERVGFWGSSVVM